MNISETHGTQILIQFVNNIIFLSMNTKKFNQVRIKDIITVAAAAVALTNSRN
ncbi:MAG: hypothetical protein WA667_15485 [Candidatus Nitrosopolaris sp.]